MLADRGRPSAAVMLVAGVTAAYAAGLAVLSLLRYEAFASDFDHGIFSQYVWLLGHAREPFNTITLRSMLGDHVEPGLALLAPLGTAGVAAPGLLVVQALALAGTAPVLYLAARAHGASERIAAVGPVLWCASPVVIHVGYHDFHPEALVPILLAAGLLALARGRTGWFVVTAVVACSMKEDVALTYAALGVVLAWDGRRRLGLGLAGTALAYSLVAVYAILPYFGPAATEEFGPRFAGDRGNTVADAFVWMAKHPLTTVSGALTPATIGILALLVATTGGLALLAPRWLLVVVPAAALNLLSAHDLQKTIDYHYWIVPVGAVAVAGAVGAGRVSPTTTRSWLRLAAGLAVVLGVLSLQWASAIAHQVRTEWPRRADRTAVLAAIPANASVTAPMQMLSHLAERKTLYVLPEPLIAQRVGTQWGEKERAEATRELEYAVVDPGLRPWGQLTDAEIEQELVRRGFREILRRGDVRLFRQGGAG